MNWIFLFFLSRAGPLNKIMKLYPMYPYIVICIIFITHSYIIIITITCIKDGTEVVCDY